MRRHRKTRLSVLLSERVSRVLITASGIGTIGAVSLILVFLIWVVLPLFLGASVGDSASFDFKETGRPVQVLANESRHLGAVVQADGRAFVHELATGELIATSDAPEPAPTVSVVSVRGDVVTHGLPDGTVRRGKVDFGLSYPTQDEVPEDLRDLESGQAAPAGGALIERMEDGSYRRHELEVEWKDPVETGSDAPIVALDHLSDEGTSTICVLTAEDELLFVEVSEKPHMITRKIQVSSERYTLPYEPRAGAGAPDHLLLAGRGDNLYLLWADGSLVRMDLRDPEEARVAQILDVLPEDDATISTVRFLSGRGTLLIGDTKGRIRGWFPTKPDDAGTIDGVVLAQGNDLPGGGAAATSLAPSSRSRIVAAGYADGTIRLFHVTSGTSLGEVEIESGAEPGLLALFPKEDGLAALTRDGLATWEVDLRYPEASFAGLFRPVWYEGYTEPEHVWQSSAATDESEPKFGMVPLVFGTIKATVYSMLFGAPLALLAAIYTSEFLTRRVRVPVKSAIEMMASLPSVVLGFLGALVIAPFVYDRLTATLCCIVTVPVTLLFGAYLWQLLPRATALRLAGWPRLVAISLCLPVALFFARAIAPAVESLLFAGDLIAWLDGSAGNGTGGWMILFLPLSALVVVFGFGRWVGPWLRRRSAEWSPRQYAHADLVRFGLGAAVTLALAFAVSKLLDLASLDPRGSYVDTYIQGNALIVGFVMGFAVVPIIYTLAEDALSSVPDHLRLASLGAGATPWQTASRVVVPTAMSGLFSALMMGLGRAVGETMIVLMATGNTAIMEWNVFNGFRTLSANIAVELPEAVQNSAHYRTLFLAALVLFAMTFVLNTVAELVRQRFRKRSYQL